VGTPEFQESQKIMHNKITSKKLIINADDFGWDDDSCKATIECMEAGSITSATIMTGRPATDIACEYAAANSHRFSFGLHLNIVDHHKPLSENPTSLVDSTTAAFRMSDQQRIRALFWQLNSFDLQNELKAQLEVLKRKGVKVSHIDSHGHLHKFPCVITALKNSLDQSNIKCVRRPQNLYGTGSKIKTKIINRTSSLFFKSLILTDYFLTISSYKDAWFSNLLTLLPNGITELAVHPGHTEKWRNEEVQPLLDKKFPFLLEKNGIQLTNFNNII
jgi:hypothetical protein